MINFCKYLRNSLLFYLLLKPGSRWWLYIVRRNCRSCTFTHKPKYDIYFSGDSTKLSGAIMPGWVEDKVRPLSMLFVNELCVCVRVPESLQIWITMLPCSLQSETRKLPFIPLWKCSVFSVVRLASRSYKSIIQWCHADNLPQTIETFREKCFDFRVSCRCFQLNLNLQLYRKRTKSKMSFRKWFSTVWKLFMRI